MSIKNAASGILKMLVKKYNLWDVKLAEHWEERLEVCKACTNSPFCPSCGCIIEAKVLEDEESCPEGKWKT